MVNIPHHYNRQMLDVHRKWEGDGIQIAGAPVCAHQFVEDHGIEWAGEFHSDSRFRKKDRLRECFRNSYLRARRHKGLHYAEGFAHAGLITVHHAWNVTDDGTVIDFTWRSEIQTQIPPEQWEYFGIVFDVHSYDFQMWWDLQPVYSILFTWPHHKLDLTEHIHPLTKEIRSATLAA